MWMKIENLKIAMAAFQQHSRQRLVDKYKHMNSQNDSLDVRLNPLCNRILLLLLLLSMKKVM